jgi:DNA-binding transcriptional ArsR family regulator
MPARFDERSFTALDCRPKIRCLVTSLMASMTPHVAEIANLIGDLARANILLALMDNRALTAKELALAARVSPQTTSFHLVKLTNAKLLQVDQQGRHRYYRLASPLVAQMLEAAMVVAGDRLSGLRPLSKASEELRAARSCYDHLAGRLGVAFAEALKARGFIILDAEGAELTPSGVDFLNELGLEFHSLPRTRRMFWPCLDWSERRYHLAGHLGALFLGFCLERQWLERRSDSRALRVTRLGAEQFAEICQIEHQRSTVV